ncbi:uncharacterized protein [Asterias amurensis]|uniref:uncharacterized protein n=1 Tax=Asterias amurensis TaxID=7602 RepID=UPI003AB69DAD
MVVLSFKNVKFTCTTMALSPQEQTWAQLQENLRRKRHQLGFGSHRDSGGGKHFNGYKKPQPAPLPRLLDSPPEAPLRGTHYPVIPPVANDRYFESDDNLSLQSYDSEIPISLNEDYPTFSLQSSSPPYSHNGTARGHYPNPQANRDPWNTSTKVKRDSRYFLPADQKHRQARRPQDGGMRVAGRHEVSLHGRHVWRDPREEAELENDSATVVQRHYRGYRTRKSLEMLHYLQHPTSAGIFMHHFLKDLLQHDIILDVVCEVLVEARTGRKVMHARATASHQGVVNTLTIRHSPTPTQRIWREALVRPDIHKPVAAKLILEVLQEEYRDLVLDGVNELVEDYFGAKVVADSTNQIITEVVEEMIPDAFNEAGMEVAMEAVVKDMIDEETQSCLGVLLEETFVMGKMPLDTADEQLERREVARVAESFLVDTTFLDHLLLAVVRNGQSWNPLEQTDRFLDDQLLKILLGQYTGILYNRQATEECIPLKRLHEKVMTDMALDVILTELTDQLTEDLVDLNEDEQRLST